LFSVVGELAPGLTLGAGDPGSPPTTFARAEARVSSYVGLGALVFHSGIEGGIARTLDGSALPFEERYRLGGTGSVRGFRRDGVGPRNEVAQPDLAWPSSLDPIIDHVAASNPTRWVATGGDTQALVTGELLVPLPFLGLPAYEGYFASIYADVGNVWLFESTATSEFPQYDAIFSPPLRYSIGVGLRVSTPVGPLQLDVAANPAAAFAEGARRELLRDEWDEPPIRAHIALGTLF
jgi:outer membrane protein assembly factor BamA